MTVKHTLSTAIAMTLFSTPLVLADAKGQVKLSRATFTIADAVAYKTDDGIEVALLSARFDRQAAAKDQKIDSFDIMRTDGMSITLRIGSDGSFNCIDFRSDSGGGSSCNSNYTPALKITARTADRIAGTFKLNAGGESADITFDLPVESKAARTGTALPAGGGDPGKAVIAHYAALEKNDWAALKASASPDQRKQLDEAEKTGENKDVMQMLRRMSPTKIRVLGGTVNGDQAEVDYEGQEDGKTVKGVADVQRIGGRWYMMGSNQ